MDSIRCTCPPCPIHDKDRIRDLEFENGQLRSRIRELERAELRALRERDKACIECGAPNPGHYQGCTLHHRRNP